MFFSNETKHKIENWFKEKVFHGNDFDGWWCDYSNSKSSFDVSGNKFSFKLSWLLELKDISRVDDIDVGDFSHSEGNCPTCDFGSKDSVTFYFYKNSPL